MTLCYSRMLPPGHTLPLILLSPGCLDRRSGIIGFRAAYLIQKSHSSLCGRISIVTRDRTLLILILRECHHPPVIVISERVVQKMLQDARSPDPMECPRFRMSIDSTVVIVIHGRFYPPIDLVPVNLSQLITCLKRLGGKLLISRQFWVSSINRYVLDKRRNRHGMDIPHIGDKDATLWRVFSLTISNARIHRGAVWLHMPVHLLILYWFTHLDLLEMTSRFMSFPFNRRVVNICPVRPPRWN